jgi:hypothetical protein
MLNASKKQIGKSDADIEGFFFSSLLRNSKASITTLEPYACSSSSLDL